MPTYNIKLLFKTITAEIPLPSEMDHFYKHLVKKGLASNPAEVHTRGPLDRASELLLRKLDVPQLHELVSLLQSDDAIGGFQVWAYSENLIKKDIGTGGLIHEKTGVNLKETEKLAPLIYDVVRDPGKPVFLTDICLFGLRNEPITAQAWRSMFIAFGQANILSQYEADWRAGQDFQTLRISKMGTAQTAALIDLITGNPEIGAWRIRCSSSFVKLPKNDGMLNRRTKEMIINTFSIQKEVDRQNAQLAEMYKTETPVRIGLNGVIND
jgi:hypothetical protein